MSTQPFGAAGFGFPGFGAPDWERMTRQWFGAGTAPAPTPADPFAWWQPRPAAPAAMDPTQLANQWLGQIQQLATQFAGREAQPADVVRAWRSMVGDSPFAQGAAASAFMPAALFSAPGASPLDMPAFGYTREHQERVQQFARDAAAFQQAAQAFQAIIGEAGQDAFSRFESLLARRAAEGKPVETARALFDLWIDAAEDAYADIALGERFQKAFGDYVNAQMRVRAAAQKEVELTCAQWGIPGRQEVDAAHRRITQLEREIRRLRDAVEAATAPASQTPAHTAAAPVQQAASRASTAEPAREPAPRARKAAAPRKSTPTTRTTGKR